MTAGITFHDDRLIADMTARMLLEINAVYFNAEQPSIFTSGWASPVYIDCRRLISYPRIRSTITDYATSVILRKVGFEAVDAIAGGETAGIPYAAWIADRLGLPMQYVRKKPKGFGRNAQIEGELYDGERILLVEDLTTDGQSKANFCEALRSAGAVVDHIFVIFHYGIFPQSQAAMAEIGATLHSLATWWDVLRVAKEGGYFEPRQIDEIESFLNEPAEWSKRHGGIARGDVT